MIKPVPLNLPNKKDNETRNPCHGASLIEGSRDNVSLTILTLYTDRRLSEMLDHSVGRLVHNNGCGLLLLTTRWRWHILAFRKNKNES